MKSILHIMKNNSFPYIYVNVNISHYKEEDRISVRRYSLYTMCSIFESCLKPYERTTRSAILIGRYAMRRYTLLNFKIRNSEEARENKIESDVLRFREPAWKNEKNNYVDIDISILFYRRWKRLRSLDAICIILIYQCLNLRYLLSYEVVITENIYCTII